MAITIVCQMPHQPRPSFQSPRFAQPATFMRLPHVDDPHGLDVAIVGVPYDGGTSYRPGARLGPREIRSQSSLIRSYSYFQKVAPFDVLNVADVGDVDAPPVSIDKAYEAIEARIGAIADAGARPLVAGGDHSISLPILRALAKRHGPLALVQFDAHIDTWDEYFGGKYFHGTPFRRAIEEGIIEGRRFIQVGIRGPMYGEEDFEFHREHGITMIDIDQVKARGIAWTVEEIRRVLTGPSYMTFDIDGVDPAFAPGTGTPEFEGLTSHEAQQLVRGLAGLPLVGGDVVEVSPLFDGPGQITALLAANLMFEFLCAVAPLNVPSVRATPNLFAVLGANAMLGRTFVEEEGQPGSDRVAALSRAFWQHHFGGSPSVIGRKIQLDAQPYTVVGVMPAEFDFPPSGRIDIWTPLSFDPNDAHGRSRKARSLSVVGRLADTVSQEQAQREMTVIAARLATTYPDSKTGWGVRVIAAQQQLVTTVKPALRLITAAVGVL